MDVAVWRIDGPEPVEVAATELPLEEHLEDVLAARPDVLGEPLLLIGRQVPTGLGGIVDLVTVDGEGALHVIELKRDRTHREVVAQIFDYAAVGAIARGRAEVWGQPCYPTAHAVAAAYLPSLVASPVLERENGAFGAGCARYFLPLNGLEPQASPADWAALVVDIAEHRVDVRGVAARIRGWLG